MVTQGPVVEKGFKRGVGGGSSSSRSRGCGSDPANTSNGEPQPTLLTNSAATVPF
jgi:hypothetical protein